MSEGETTYVYEKESCSSGEAWFQQNVNKEICAAVSALLCAGPKHMKKALFCNKKKIAL